MRSRRPPRLGGCTIQHRASKDDKEKEEIDDLERHKKSNDTYLEKVREDSRTRMHRPPRASDMAMRTLAMRRRENVSGDAAGDARFDLTVSGPPASRRPSVQVEFLQRTELREYEKERDEKLKKLSRSR